MFFIFLFDLLLQLKSIFSIAIVALLIHDCSIDSNNDVDDDDDDDDYYEGATTTADSDERWMMRNSERERGKEK